MIEINVFDFDNTIYDGESAIDMYMMLVKHHPFLLKHIPTVVSAIVKYKRAAISIDEVLETYRDFLEEIWRSIDDLEEILLNEFWKKNFKNIKSFYFDIHTDNDVVVSASPELLLEEPCRRLGIRDCIASRVDMEKRQILFPCFRENKVKAFLEKYPDTEIENFYTDSKNDKAMMDISKNVYLVKGNKIQKIK